MVAKKTRKELELAFEAGAKPTGTDFANFINSVLNKVDDGIERPSGKSQPLKILPQGDEQNLLDFGGAEGEADWRINRKPADGKSGLNFSLDGESKLYIEDETGNIGIGTTNTKGQRLKVIGDANIEGTLSANKVTGEGAVLPGMIMMWFGSKDDIPVGWALCNGDNGTPDLRDKFIVSIGEKYQLNDQGGSDSVTLTVNQIPSHNHADGDFKYLLKSDGKFTSNVTDDTTGEPNIVRKGSIKSVGGGEAHENRPPYYALCFIMKL